MGEQQSPADPFTPLQEAMGGLYELFDALKKQGFTEFQACNILGVMLANGAAAAGTDGS